MKKLSTKVDSIPSAGAKADSYMLPIAGSSSHNSSKPNVVRCFCMVCGNEFQGEEPTMCCSGRDCGCMGMPIDPVVCSDECYNNLPMFKNRNDEKEKVVLDEK
jgi:hypothetical protein